MAHRGAQALGDATQWRIAGDVPQAVVDRVETVDIDDDDPRGARVPHAAELLSGPRRLSRPGCARFKTSDSSIRLGRIQ